MTSLYPGASRSPNSTGVCCAGVGTLSAQKVTMCTVSHQQINQIKGQIVFYRSCIGPDPLRDALGATFVDDVEEPSGESRLKTLEPTLVGKVVDAGRIIGKAALKVEKRARMVRRGKASRNDCPLFGAYHARIPLSSKYLSSGKGGQVLWQVLYNPIF